MKKSFFIFLCGLAVVSFAPVVTAQTGCPTGLVPCGGENCPCTTCHIFEMFKNVMDFILFFIVPPLAALMIAIGGFMLVFAYLGVGDGGPGMISQAKKLFASVAIGLVIVYAAWVIVNLFFQFIGVADWTGLKGGWRLIDCEGPAAPQGGVEMPATLTPDVSLPQCDRCMFDGQGSCTEQKCKSIDPRCEFTPPNFCSYLSG